MGGIAMESNRTQGPLRIGVESGELKRRLSVELVRRNSASDLSLSFAPISRDGDTSISSEEHEDVFTDEAIMDDPVMLSVCQSPELVGFSLSRYGNRYGCVIFPDPKLVWLAFLGESLRFHASISSK
jgi:hypothetical protein